MKVATHISLSCLDVFLLYTRRKEPFGLLLARFGKEKLAKSFKMSSRMTFSSEFTAEPDRTGSGFVRTSYINSWGQDGSNGTSNLTINDREPPIHLSQTLNLI